MARGLGIAGLTIDAQHIYWIDAYPPIGSSVARADLDGSNPDLDFIPYLPWAITDVAVDGSFLDWAGVRNGEPFASIGRANWDGSGLDPTFITGLQGMYFMTLGH